MKERHTASAQNVGISNVTDIFNVYHVTRLIDTAVVVTCVAHYYIQVLLRFFRRDRVRLCTRLAQLISKISQQCVLLSLHVFWATL